MSRQSKRPTSGRAARASSTHDRGIQLDSFARDTIALFTRVMIRAGYPRALIAAGVRSEPIPRTVKPAANGSRADFNDAGHILTLWSKDPEYLLPNGTPRPISLRGAAPSIEALAAKVSARLTFEEAWEQLHRTSTLQRVGRLYVPRTEAIIYAGDREFLAANTLRVLNACLQNLEHNTVHGLKEPWYLRSAQHGDFPRAELKGYLHQSVARVMAFLQGEDSAMLRTAKYAEPAPRKVRQRDQRGWLSVNAFCNFIPNEDVPRRKSVSAGQELPRKRGYTTKSARVDRRAKSLR